MWTILSIDQCKLIFPSANVNDSFHWPMWTIVSIGQCELIFPSANVNDSFHWPMWTILSIYKCERFFPFAKVNNSFNLWMCTILSIPIEAIPTNCSINVNMNVHKSFHLHPNSRLIRGVYFLFLPKWTWMWMWTKLY